MKLRIVFLVCLVFLVCCAFVSAESIQESYQATPDSPSSVSSTAWRAETIRIGASGNGITFTLSKLQLWFNVTDLGNYTFLVQNNTGAAFQPNGQNVSYGSLVFATLGNGTPVMKPYNISMNGGILYAGFNYTIIGFNNISAGSDNGMWTKTTSPAYSGGNMTSSNNAGVTWTNTSTDYPFILYAGADSINPVLNYPNSGTNTLNASLVFNSSASPIAVTLINATLYIWNSTGIFNTTTNTVLGTHFNSTTWNVTGFTLGSYSWNVLWCGTNSSGGVQCESPASNFTFGFIPSENINTFNASTYETSLENFYTNTTLPAGTTLSAAYLNWNGTSYLGAFIAAGTNAILTRAIDIPLGSGSHNWFWDLRFTNGVQVNLTTQNQNASVLNFTLCSPSFSTPYINFTFKDEQTLSPLNASISSATFVYWLGSGGITKTLTYINTTENPSYAFCLSANNRTLYTSPSVQYASTGYPQRNYIPGTLTLTNVTTNTTLYLLASANGLFVTFQVLNLANQPLSGVAVNITRVIAGTTTIIGQGTTGSDGGITFWLDPDFVHTACFFLAPYPSICVTQAFTQSSYTITLGSAGSGNVSDYTRGITYSISPISSYLSNGTTYNFNFTIASSFWTLNSFGFNLTNASGFLLGSTSATGANGGTASLNLSTGTQKAIYITYFWIINGTQTSASRSWLILDLSDSSFSIAHLATDFSLYITTGLFGITNFGVGLLIFLIILGITGLVKMNYGVSNESALLGVVFALVALFDVGLNLVPNPIGAVAHFPSIFMGILFVGFMFKEIFT